MYGKTLSISPTSHPKGKQFSLILNEIFSHFDDFRAKRATQAGAAQAAISPNLTKATTITSGK